MSADSDYKFTFTLAKRSLVTPTQEGGMRIESDEQEDVYTNMRTILNNIVPGRAKANMSRTFWIMIVAALDAAAQQARNENDEGMRRLLAFVEEEVIKRIPH
tara:strand:- start:48 stop:353 length:306 start_codon:yes stop_codon:yes gene_type:complete